MNHRKALLSGEELLVRDKVNKASERVSDTREQTLHMQTRTKLNTYDKHKHLSCSLCRGLCTSVLFISLFPLLMPNSLIVHRLIDFKCFLEQRRFRILDCCCFTI